MEIRPTDEFKYWNEKAILYYRIPLDIIDSRVYEYRSLREKYNELDNIIGNQYILSDLKGISEYYPMLAEVCLEQGTKNLKIIDDIAIPQISTTTQKNIRSNDMDIGETFLNSFGYICIEILKNFYMENEYQIVNDKFVSSIINDDTILIRYLIENEYSISKNAIIDAMKINKDKIDILLPLLK
jgi:hypothetical protein